jgi:hypothetical protein
VKGVWIENWQNHYVCLRGINTLCLTVGLCQKRNGPKEQSDTNSKSSSQSSTEDSQIVKSEETASQASSPHIPVNAEKDVGNTDESLPIQAIPAQKNSDQPQEREFLPGPWVCTLTLGLLGASTEAAQLLLLPDPNAQTDADAYPLYEKAIRGLGTGVSWQNVSGWLKIDGPGFPVEEADQTLAAFAVPLEHLELGSKCRQCTWPKVKVGAMVPHLTELRQLIFLVALKARTQIEERRFADASASLQVGMALTYHLGQAPLVMQGQVARAMESVLYRQLRHWVQTPGSPSLYGAILALPPSPVDIGKQFQYEANNLSFLQRLACKRGKKQILDPAQARLLFMQKRTNRELAALQVIEALRHYASTHEGRFPQAFAELARAVPDDPTTGKPFMYRLEQGTAIIESTPKEAGPKELLQYILQWR